MVYRRCNSPNHPEGVERWHPREEECSVCGGRKSPFNKALATAKLNNHLYGMAARQ